MGLIAVRLFLGMNDHDRVAGQDEKLDLITAIAGGELRAVEQIAERIASHADVRPRSTRF